MAFCNKLGGKKTHKNRLSHFYSSSALIGSWRLQNTKLLTASRRKNNLTI